MALDGTASSLDLKAVRQGLKQAGYFENRNIAIKYCSANGRFDRYRHSPPCW